MSDCIKKENVTAGTVFYSDQYPSQEIWYENYVNTVAYYGHGFYYSVVMVIVKNLKVIPFKKW